MYIRHESQHLIYFIESQFSSSPIFSGICTLQLLSLSVGSMDWYITGCMHFHSGFCIHWIDHDGVGNDTPRSNGVWCYIVSI